MTALRVSENIDAWCNKCGFLLAHVIMSVNGDKPHRVKCKSCKDVHAFRLAAPGSAKAARSTRSRTAAAKKAPRRTAFEQQLDGRDQSTAIPYAMNLRFEVDDLVSHPKFGLGLVLRQAAPDKVEILFSAGPKVLVCGRLS